MGRLRSAAKHLARFTERRIPDPARRWASAVTRELDYIESDWHSLTWAFSGLRLLILHGFVPTPTPARIERQAMLHGRLRRQTAQRSFASRLLNRATTFISALLFLYLLHRFYPAHPFTVLGIGLFCTGFLALLLSGLRQPTITIPDEADTQALLALYQTDLRRSTQLSSLINFTFPALLIFAGTELLAPTLWVRVLGLLWIVILLLYLQSYRANRLTLDALDEAID
jgi:hypothetical protein